MTRGATRTNSGLYEAVIKVDVKDEPRIRARDIAEGLGYACALLMDEYGWSATDIANRLEEVADDVWDEEARRGT